MQHATPTRHTLARFPAALGLSCLAAGCFSTGVRGDGGAPDAGGAVADAGPDAGPDRCGPAPVDEVRHTPTVLAGSAAVVTVRATAVSTCSCTPRGVVGSGTSMALDVCNCCDLCECIDPGYEATATFPGLDEGPHAIGVPDHPDLTATVVPVDGCPGAATVDAVEVDGPGDRITAGPRTHWARIEGHVESCCDGDPQPVVLLSAPAPPGAVHLEARHCDLCKVLCAEPFEVPFVTWHPMLDLPSGAHELVVGGASASFEVAAR